MTRVKVKTELSAEEAAEKLSQLALGLATGQVPIEDEGRRDLLHPGSHVKLQVKGSEGDDGGKLVIEVSWKPHLRIEAFPPVHEAHEEDTNGR